MFIKKKFGKPIRHGKRRRLKTYILLIFVLITIIFIFLEGMIDKRLFPTAVKIAGINAQAAINKCINASVKKIITELDLDSNDFYVKSFDNNGKINSLSANTLLINDVCGRLAVEIFDQLTSSAPMDISIPVGSLLGVNVLANIGPGYNVRILPRGNTVVDYETEFLSAGINQINFQIWLNVESTIQIVNPLQNKELVITRKIALVNTVINGEVPPAYINARPE